MHYLLKCKINLAYLMVILVIMSPLLVSDWLYFVNERQVLPIGHFPSNKKIKAWFSLAHMHKYKHTHMCKQVKTGST